MHWKAIAIIGGFTLVLWLVLYLPGRWLGRAMLQRLPTGAVGRQRVTQIGLALYLIVALILVTGLAFISSWMGRVFLVLGCILFSTVCEVILKRFGISALRDPQR